MRNRKLSIRDSDIWSLGPVIECHCSPEEQEERTIKGWIGKDNGGEETWWEPTLQNYGEAGNTGPEMWEDQRWRREVLS